jgi:hypothetical protein
MKLRAKNAHNICIYPPGSKRFGFESYRKGVSHTRPSVKRPPSQTGRNSQAAVVASLDNEEIQKQNEIIAELQELTAQYRSQLSSLDETINGLEKENENLKLVNEQYEGLGLLLDSKKLQMLTGLLCSMSLGS